MNVEDQLPSSLSITLLNNHHPKIDFNRASIRHNKLAELLRRSTSNQLQCSMFCGGRRCKYDNPDGWPIEDRALEPLYSHWITDNILAMARPNTDMIFNDNLIDLFRQSGINTIINLQEPGEHANCGPPLETTSGFTYDPKIFMDNNIYFYNYKWRDFLDINEESMADMVKVLTFALYQGRVAIHCHAGLGRTGTLIAAFLIYTFRCRVMDAINFVRSKRPNSIQSRSQISILFKFANYIAPCFIVYNKLSSSSIRSIMPNTLEEFLHRQNRLLHGKELRILRYIPKIVFIICEKLLQLTTKTTPTVKTTINTEINRLNDSKEEWENFTHNYLSHPYHSSVEIDYEKILMDDQKNGTKLRTKSESSSSSLSSTSQRRHSQEDEQRLIDALTDNVNDVRDEQITDAKDMENLNNMDSSKLMAEHRASMIFDSDLFNSSSSSSASSSFDNSSTKLSQQTIIEALIEQPKNDDQEFMKKILDYQREINNKPSGWNRLRFETDVKILSALLMTWFEMFDVPILNNRIIVKLNNYKKQRPKQNFINCFHSIEIGTRFTLEYLARFIIKLSSPISDDSHHHQHSKLVARFIASLAMKKIRFKSEILPYNAKRTWPFMDDRSQILLDYFHELIHMVIAHDRSNQFN
ncbi:Protein tyrosine phosphatase domain-containing protein 1 [Dermatophagoides pteronyssinus]|uniref:Protein tyrosine phosphatase domain-containing protein 1 n=1 Tax=Dermatophagoides pteronyssinus TaxID=6956 RepID=A0ABQ8IYI3_DERPT|nr:Protein tyrosine phosphatase domain-containing protein 1 [Dermatophagoides pteronyssinus]